MNNVKNYIISTIVIVKYDCHAIIKSYTGEIITVADLIYDEFMCLNIINEGLI